MAHKWSLVVALVFSCAFAASGGCSPRLGNKCKSGTDCSVNGDRTCDIAQPGGYCTILDCSPGGCGDEGYCVRFRPDEPRLARNYCMAKCSKNRDCNRKREHKDYACRTTDQLNDQDGSGEIGDYEMRNRIAEIIDKKTSGKICVVKEERVDAGLERQSESESEPEPEPEADAAADAGTDGG